MGRRPISEANSGSPQDAASPLHGPCRAELSCRYPIPNNDLGSETAWFFSPLFLRLGLAQYAVGHGGDAADV